LHRIKIQELPDELEISPSEVREALYNNPSIDTEKILKNMADEVEPWQKILGRENFEKRYHIIRSKTIDFTRLPKHSEVLVNKAWKKRKRMDQ